jgi:hypothetical protein
MRKFKSNVFKKTKKFIKNKNKRRQTNKKYRAVKKMYGGTYDTNNVFDFLDSAIFRGKSSIIKFETFSGETYNISKNPNKLLEICDSSDDIVILEKITDEVKTNIADITDQLSGMFFLYGTDRYIGKSVGVKRHYYGLFYLLNRIELLAVLLKLKKTPRFSSIDVHFPIDENSRLPGDYNKFPHGYFYSWDQGHTNEKLSSFFAFMEKIKQVETELLMSTPVETDEIALLELVPSASAVPGEHVSKNQEKLIDGLEIPSFIRMLRMEKSKITPDEPEEDEEEEEEDLEFIRNDKRERQRQRRERMTYPEIKHPSLPNDRAVIAAIVFINNIIERINKKDNLQIQKLPVDVNGVNTGTFKRIKKTILLYDKPSVNPDKKEYDSKILENLRILESRYNSQKAGKKKI